MTAEATNIPAPKRRSLYQLDIRTRRRNAAETRFRAYGIAAIGFGMLALAVLLSSILGQGLSAFSQTRISLEVPLDAAVLDKSGKRDPAELAKATTLAYGKILDQALVAQATGKGLMPEGLSAKDATAILSKEAPAQLRRMVLDNPALIGTTVHIEVLANGRIDGFLKGRVTMESAQFDSNVTPGQLALAQNMKDAGLLAKSFNLDFITAPDASEVRPEAAGLGVAILGSLYMMMIVLVLALPIGVAASIYLEEFAAKNWFTDLIEVNIANLAAVPSIVYGILGLAVFINFAGMPQSSPLVGGLVMTLMTLPTIIIATRASLRAVPPSIKDAALGIGASKTQTVLHHVLPLAMPGIMTGTIIGMAHALGETAPLLLIGMVAFVRDYPSAPPEGFLDPASALPVQVYNFTRRADPAFLERASGAIIVLLVFLALMNVAAILLRRKFERRW